MPHRTIRIRKRTVTARPQKKICHCAVKKKRRRGKVNYAQLRKWKTRAHHWVTKGKGLLNPTQKANWDRFRVGFREGFHKVLDPIVRIATPFLSMIPGEGPLIAAGLNGINGLIPR